MGGRAQHQRAKKRNYQRLRILTLNFYCGFPSTLLFYGHFDKQPPFTGWEEGLGATIPVIKDGKLYGRGGADDGYSTYGTMIAIKAVQEQNIPLPRCVMIT